MTDRRVLRYEVPVDGEQHAIAQGRVLMVASRLRGFHPSPYEVPAGRVEIWVEVETDEHFPVTAPDEDRLVLAVGTGQPVPEGACWLGSCLDASLVWHVYELDVEAEQPEPDDEGGIVAPRCGMCGRERTLDDAYDYNPAQVVTGRPLGWYSGDDGEICPECMEQTIRGQRP